MKNERDEVFLAFGVNVGLIPPEGTMGDLTAALNGPRAPWPDRAPLTIPEGPEPIRVAVRDFLAGGPSYYRPEDR